MNATDRLLNPEPPPPQLKSWKKAVMSCATAAGSSAGAKCPPRGKTVQRWMLYRRSKYERGSSPLGNGLVRENTKRRGRTDVGGINRVPAIVPIVAHRRGDALRDPVQGERGAEEVVGRRNVAPRVPLLTHVCREPCRGVVESIADGVCGLVDWIAL